LLIGDSQSIIITIVQVVTIRDHKSRIAPTLVGVFLLSIHSIPSHQLRSRTFYSNWNDRYIQQAKKKSDHESDKIQRICSRNVGQKGNPQIGLQVQTSCEKPFENAL